jgi:WD40 repeat protein
MAPRMLFRTVDGVELARLVGHSPAPIGDLDFSPDGTRLVSTAVDGTARLWDVATGRQLTLLEVAQQPIMSARFRPDGALVATGTLDETARILEIPSGRLLASAPGVGSIYGVRFSPDGSRLLIMSMTAPPLLWRVADFTGSAEDLAAVLRCYVPFRVEGGGLAPATPESRGCRPVTSAP